MPAFTYLKLSTREREISMNTNLRKDKSIVVTAERAVHRTMIVRVDGQREYDTQKISAASAKRLHKVLESIPTAQRQVDFAADFTLTVYLHWKRHPRPEAVSESGDAVYHDEFGQGTTRFYHSFGAVRMARVRWQTGRESSVPVDALHYTQREDTPRTENIGGGNPAAVLDAPEVLGEEYNRYRNTVDMAERIEAGGRIPAVASLALAQHLVDAKCTADKVFIATACYGFDTNLYGVIFPLRGVWYLVCGWLTRSGNLHVVDTDFAVDVTLVRRAFGFSHREALIVEVAI